MSDTNTDNLGKEDSGDEKEVENSNQKEEENVVLNVEKKKKPRKQLSPEDQAKRLENLKKGREAAHAKRRELEATVKVEKIKKLQDEVDKATKGKTDKKEYKEPDPKESPETLEIIKKKKKKKVIIEESSSSEEEVVVRRRKRKDLPPPPPPEPAVIPRRPAPTAEERQATIDRANQARERARQIAMQKAKQDKMMQNIFG